MGRDAQVVYLGREKVKGVPHHAKAGNINSALLKESPGKGVFVLVLDCGKALVLATFSKLSGWFPFIRQQQTVLQDSITAVAAAHCRSRCSFTMYAAAVLQI